MAVSKTKTRLIEVARQLFATKGVMDTTMNDIAEASGKGRRTLYTYFRSKEDVYLACIETELQMAVAALQEVSKAELEPDERIKLFIKVHFDTFKDMVIRNGNLHAQFFRDIVEVEKVRRKLDKKEMVMLAQILEEGQSSGVFAIRDAKKTAQLILFSIKGLEVPYIRESVLRRKQRIQHIFDFLFFGLKGVSDPT